MRGEHIVIDAVALLDLLLAGDVGPWLDLRLEGCVLHASGQIDADVAAGLRTLERAGVVSPGWALSRLRALAVAPIERHLAQALLDGAWHRRDELELSVALDVELARSLGVALITTDPSVARATTPVAELVGLGRTGP